eukprot:GHVN01076517.1.p1 GENE.GHVN01076517.1~~GHVN01076517.1.p1  ORF type:complete len:610 (+),score=48.81 GHVN01076517.1:851-2680(+)
MSIPRLWQISPCGRFAGCTIGKSQYQILSVDSGAIEIDGQLLGQVVANFSFFSRTSIVGKRHWESNGEVNIPNVVIISREGSILCINLHSHEEVYRVQAPTSSGETVIDCALSEKCDALFLLTSQRSIRRYQLSDGAFGQSMNHELAVVNAIAVNKAGTLLACASERKVQVFALSSSGVQLSHKCGGCLLTANTLRFSPCSKFLLAGFSSSQMMVWRTSPSAAARKRLSPIFILTSHQKLMDFGFWEGEPTVVYSLACDSVVSCWNLGPIEPLESEDGVLKPVSPSVTISDHTSLEGHHQGDLKYKAIGAKRDLGTRVITLIIARCSAKGTTEFNRHLLKVSKDGSVLRRKNSDKRDDTATFEEPLAVPRREKVSSQVEFEMRSKALFLRENNGPVPSGAGAKPSAMTLHKKQQVAAGAFTKLGATNSVASVAEQGLQSRDPHFVEQLFKISNPNVIRTTISEIRPESAAELLRESINKLLDNPARLKEVREWIRQILMQHAGYLLMKPDLCREALHQLYEHMTDRVSYEETLTRLVGRVEGVLHQSASKAKQRKTHNKFRAESLAPLVHHVEGSAGTPQEADRFGTILEEAPFDEAMDTDDDLHGDDD